LLRLVGRLPVHLLGGELLPDRRTGMVAAGWL
jgi:hypothetical protein